ncbi:Gluconolactonase [Labilithrix luteola]|uniref:Gluconolactonase n=1 Tax=Labilithrix luteola TaxID=1391654 RepID=A0A0K1Q0U8_9BACT|nr:SMP-30/gluconolactonase/LRE family protein [Labilithrix luteola]AKU99246.1 Gluconolactonase [Labilithrix luteola]
MKRFLPFALVLCSGAWIYACSSSDGSNNNGPPSDTTNGENGNGNPDPNNPSGNDGGGGGNDASPTEDSSTPDATSNVNPIEGATAKSELEVENVDGLVWKTDAVYFTLPYQQLLVKYTPGRTPDPTDQYVTSINALGITFDEKANTLLFANSNDHGVAELRRVEAGKTGPFPIATTAVAMTQADGGATPPPYSPNDAVVRKSDGTIFLTDPGYQSGNITNGVYRLSPQNKLSQVAAYTEERPNGIALSPDSATLYVSLTQNQDPPGTTIPSIVKFTVAADGTTGTATKFVDVGPADAAPDGLTVDTGGNVYVATKTGVQVFAADGKKWGQITTAKPATNVAFGGADAKTLYISTTGGIFSAQVKIAGLGQ